MDPRPGPRIADLSSRGAASDGGLTSIQFVVAVALSLVFVAGLLDVAVVQYGNGAMRSALDAGVRAGSRIGAAPQDCQAAAGEWLTDVLGGTRGDDVVLRCWEAGGLVRATAEASWDAWLPGVPAWEVRLSAVRAKEVVP